MAKEIYKPLTDPWIGGKPLISVDAMKLPGTDKTDGGTSSSGGGGAAAASSGVDRGQQLMDAYNRMYEVFSPGEIDYEAESEETIREKIGAWLRPAYDKAIAAREKQTDAYGAELDADAIARGMGASTYVTDVKSRQQDSEAEDIAALESDYGAALLKAVSERLESEKDRMLDVEMYNRDLSLDVADMAYAAAGGMLGGSSGGGGSGGARRSSGSRRTGSTTGSTATTSYEQCAAFLRILDNDERAAVYTGSDAQSTAYRNEIIASVGPAGYYGLMSRYNITP